MLEFGKRILCLGFGSVAQCTLPILFKHLRVPPQNVTVMDFEDCSKLMKPWTDQGVHFVRDRIALGGSRPRAGQIPVGRRCADRPGLEHRLLRDRRVVPRPRRPLYQHLGRSLGPPTTALSTNIPRKRTAVLAAHARAQDACRLDRARTERPCSKTRARTRG